jgi:hypothetical protein
LVASVQIDYERGKVIEPVEQTAKPFQPGSLSGIALSVL